MKILADESLEYPVILFLRENSLDVLAVRLYIKLSPELKV